MSQRFFPGHDAVSARGRDHAAVLAGGCRAPPARAALPGVRPHAHAAHADLPECRSADVGWQQVSGRGEVYTYTIVHRPIAQGQPLPTVIAVIELEGRGRRASCSRTWSTSIRVRSRSACRST
jgi:hypothetical protein